MLVGIVVAGVLVEMIGSPGICSEGYDGNVGVDSVGVVVDVGIEWICSGLAVVVVAVVTSGACTSVNATEVTGSGIAVTVSLSVFLASAIGGAWFELSEW